MLNFYPYGVLSLHKHINLNRINHHLGEELFDNLLVLRFSNLVFEPLWSRNYIRNVQIVFSEDFGIAGRGRCKSIPDLVFLCRYL